jgi:hypothetical protein
MKAPGIVSLALALLGGVPTWAQEQVPCHVLCAPKFKVEPTITVSNLFGSPRIASDDTVTRERRETDFETILSLGLPTRVRRLEFTVEAIFLPFDRGSTPELEFETNFFWLPGERTRGWVSSHVDVVNKFSSAERPTDRRAYTHKLNLELDTSVSIFNWLPEGRWLRGVEVEGSLDYVATGLPRAGDRIDGGRYLDKASPWSLSVVFVVPVAPM